MKADVEPPLDQKKRPNLMASRRLTNKWELCQTVSPSPRKPKTLVRRHGKSGRKPKDGNLSKALKPLRHHDTFVESRAAGHQPTHPSREIRVREHRVVGRTSQAEPSSPTFDQIDGSLRSLGEEIGRRNRGPVGPNSVAKRVEGTLDWWHLRSIHRRRSVPRKKEPDTRLQWPFEPPFDN